MKITKLLLVWYIYGSKHFDFEIHFVRENIVQKLVVDVRFKPFGSQLANILTKHISRFAKQFVGYREELG